MGLYDRLGTTPNQSLRSCAEPTASRLGRREALHGLDYIRPRPAGDRSGQSPPLRAKQGTARDYIKKLKGTLDKIKRAVSTASYTITVGFPISVSIGVTFQQSKDRTRGPKPEAPVNNQTAVRMLSEGRPAYLVQQRSRGRTIGVTAAVSRTIPFVLRRPASRDCSATERSRHRLRKARSLATKGAL